jgi:hypothetical protein
MLILCKLDANRRWTGETDELDEREPVPLGWVVAVKPKLTKGEFAEWWMNKWRITTDLPPVLEPQPYSSPSMADQPVTWGQLHEILVTAKDLSAVVEAVASVAAPEVKGTGTLPA